MWVSIGLTLAGYVVVTDVFIHDANRISGPAFLWSM